VFLLLAIFPTASGLKLSQGFVDYEKLVWGTAAQLVSMYDVVTTEHNFDGE